MNDLDPLFDVFCVLAVVTLLVILFVVIAGDAPNVLE